MSEPLPGRVPRLDALRRLAKATFDASRSWATLATLVAAVPVSAALLPNQVFHIRDLSLFFWPRYLWFRRCLFSGEWPLWDPFAAAGQSAAADALNQMFLAPALLLRLIGSERVGFNLWIAAPFPIAALGMFAYLRRRFSARASALGAIAFAVSGPVVSSGNFPNLSWSVAAMPWVLWAIDRCAAGIRRPRAVALLALIFGMQAAAGEPVTMTATGALGLAHALMLGAPGGEPGTWLRRLRESALVAAGLGLGGILGAIQLVPLEAAVAGSWRSAGAIITDFWSLHPLGLAEAVSVHLFGDYFVSQNFLALPWMPPLNSGRDPFFFSVYIGPTLLATALLGAIGGSLRRWSAFWSAIVVVAVLAASGPYTPFYPFVQSHLPFLASFRFPVKYLLVAVIAVASLAAAAWDAIAENQGRSDVPRRWRWARSASVSLLVALAVVGYALGAIALYWPVGAARAFFEVARSVQMPDPVSGAAFMLGTMPGVAARLVLLSLGAALFLGVASSRRREATLGSVVLFLLLVADLVAASWGINPTADASIFTEPNWVPVVRAHPESRFYFGGKVNGTIAARDPDGPRSFFQPLGTPPAAARSAISNEAVFFPAGRGVRELFAYDLAVLWPRPFQLVHERFLRATPAERERLLDRLAVRYRILRSPAAGSHRPVLNLTYFIDTSLYDYGATATRTAIVPGWMQVPGLLSQIERLFAADVDATRVVIVAESPPPPAGTAGPPAPPGARIVEESSHRVVVEASVPGGGGALRLLDTYSPDWRAKVDGAPAPIFRADVLFRGVTLAPGRHRVEFYYRPVAFYQGAALTAFGLVTCVVLLVLPAGRARRERIGATAGERRADPRHECDASCQSGPDILCQSPNAPRDEPTA